MFPAFGISADSKNTHCGMHVNVSLGLLGKTRDEQAEAARKLYYIINKHYMRKHGPNAYYGQK